MRDNRHPIFLIGAARSGTKFLRSCLGASSQIDIIPYDIGYVWRYGNEDKRHDQFEKADLTHQIKQYIQKTLPSLTVENTVNAKYYVEKSVPNSLRVEFLQEVFPDAVFIHLIRDGRAVIESSIRQWKSPADKSYLLKKLRYFPWRNYRYAGWFIKNIIRSKINNHIPIWGPRYKGIEEDVARLSVEQVCAKQWVECVSVAIEQLAQVKGDRVYTVKFESLMSDNNELKSLCDSIGIGDSDSVIDYHNKNVEIGNNSKSINNLNQDALDAIEMYAKPLLRKLGYD